MSSSYDIGDAPTLTATFRDLAGDPTNPTTVTATHRQPDGTETELSPSTSSTGIYTANTATLTQSGVHTVKFFGVGALVAAEEIRFKVQHSDIGT